MRDKAYRNLIDRLPDYRIIQPAPGILIYFNYNDITGIKSYELQHSIFGPLLKFNTILEKASVATFFWLVATIPFSITASMISLAVIFLLIVARLIMTKGDLFSGLKQRVSLSWIFIPLVYLISLSYSRHFYNGWKQWLILLPLVLLPFFFELFDFRKIKSSVLSVFAYASVSSILLHLLPSSYWPGDLVYTSGPMSLFYTPVQNSWIWWAALMALTLKPDKRMVDNLCMVILTAGLLYFGQLGLLLIVYILYVISEWREEKDGLTEVLTRILIFLPAFFLFGWIFFGAFQHAVVNLGNALLSVYTKEEIVGPVKWFYTDAHASLQQGWLHPFSGVGMGDYTDAMWNQYRSIGLDPPGSPYQQAGHMLVSAGVLSWIIMFVIWHVYKRSAMKVKSLAGLLLLSLFFFAPFDSLVGSIVFLIPLFISSVPDQNG